MTIKTFGKRNWSLLVASLLSGLTLVFMWSISSPPGGSPDEPTHLISIYCTSDSYSSACEEPTIEKTNLQPVKNISSCYLFQRDRSSGCEESNIFSKLKPGATSFFNKYAENSYYKFMSVFASDFYILSLLTMRVVNGIVFLGILFLSIFLLPKIYRENFIISTAIALVPLAIFLLTSINTSAWMIIGAIGMWSSLYGMLSSFLSFPISVAMTIGRALLFILSSFLLISSRTDGLYFFSIILFSVLLIFLINPVENILKKVFTHLQVKFFLATSVLLILTVTFYLMQEKAKVVYVDNNFNFLDRLFENVSRLPHILLGPMGTWGIGWLDVWLPPSTYIFMIIVFLGLAFIAIRHIDFAHSLSTIVLSVSILLLPLVILLRSGYRVGEWVQPRYILPLYFPLLGVLLFSTVKKLVLNNFQIFTLITLTSIANSFALFSNLERYLRGQNTYSYNLNVNREWWWDQLPSPNIVWLIGSISFVIFFTSLNRLSKNFESKTI